MPAWLGPAIMAGGSILSSLIASKAGKRSAGDNPALLQLMQQVANSNKYAEIAANPDDPQFRNLSSIFRNLYYNQGLEGIQRLQREQDRSRGMTGAARSEREDESRNIAATELLWKAGVQSQLEAQKAFRDLAASARGAGQVAAGGIPGFQSIDEANTQSRLGLITGVGGAFENLLFGSKGVGGLSYEGLLGGLFKDPVSQNPAVGGALGYGPQFTGSNIMAQGSF